MQHIQTSCSRDCSFPSRATTVPSATPSLCRGTSSSSRDIRTTGILHTKRNFGRLQAIPFTKGVKRNSSKKNAIPQAMMSPNVVFDAATLGVMPLYALMMWFPRATLTKRLMGSNVPVFLGGSIIYAYVLLSFGGLDLFKPLIEAVKVHGISSGCSGRYLAVLSDLLGNSTITAISWIHLLLLDLFQARWVYVDALHRQIPSIHSLVLCFMVGPLGLLSHVLTRHAMTMS